MTQRTQAWGCCVMMAGGDGEEEVQGRSQG